MAALQTLPPFIPITSRRNLPLSILIALLLIALVICAVILLIGSVYFAFTDNSAPSALWCFLIIVMLFLNAVWAWAWLRMRKKGYATISIDDKSISYWHPNGMVVRRFEWKDFQGNPLKNGPDIALQVQSGRVKGAKISSDHVCWWYLNEGRAKRHIENFSGGHIFHMARNQHELIAALLLGLAHYRPDLRIDAGLFSTFFIDKHTYQYDRKAFRKTWWISTVVVIIIFLLIDLYIRYRFGGSLFLGIKSFVGNKPIQLLFLPQVMAY